MNEEPEWAVNPLTQFPRKRGRGPEGTNGVKREGLWLGKWARGKREGNDQLQGRFSDFLSHEVSEGGEESLSKTEARRERESSTLQNFSSFTLFRCVVCEFVADFSLSLCYLLWRREISLSFFSLVTRLTRKRWEKMERRSQGFYLYSLPHDSSPLHVRNLVPSLSVSQSLFPTQDP